MIEEIFVQRSDLGGGGAIDKYRVEDVHAQHLVAEGGQRDGHAVGECLAPIAQVDPVAVKHRFGAAGDAYHIDFQISPALELVLLEGDLLDQLTADRTHAADEQVQFLILRQEEAFVHDIQGLTQILALDDEGNVALGSALREGDDADAVAAQDTEQLTRDTAVVLHVLAHDGHRRELVLPLDGMDSPAGDLRRKGLRQHLAGLFRIRRAYADGNACFRGRLAHQEHIDVLARQGGENPLVHADDSHHRGSR